MTLLPPAQTPVISRRWELPAGSARKLVATEHPQLASVVTVALDVNDAGAIFEHWQTELSSSEKCVKAAHVMAHDAIVAGAAVEPAKMPLE